VRFEIAIDITERKRTEEALARQLTFEQAVAAASTCLLSADTSRTVVNDALTFLLEASGVSRVYVFENFDDPGDGLCMRQTFEVCAPGVPPEIDNPLLQHVVYAQSCKRWREVLPGGGAIRGDVCDFPDDEREALEPQGIVSLLALPLVVEGQWWGFIGFDETRQPREWRDSEVALLRTAVEMFGAFFTRRQAQTQLRERTDRLQNITDNMFDMVSMTDMAGVFTYAGPSHRVLGFEPEELLGTTVFEYVHPDDARYIAEEFAAFTAQPDPDTTRTVEYRQRCKDGSYLWLETVGKFLFNDDDAPCALFFSSRNITEHKRAEEALRREEALLNATQRLAHVGGWEWDIEANTTMSWTEELYRIHGLEISALDIHSTNCIETSLQCYLPEDQPAVLAAFQECVDRGVPYDLEVRFIDYAGQHKWIRTTARAVKRGEKIVRAVGYIMDITERKQAEEALRESESRVRAKLNALLAPEGDIGTLGLADVVDCDQVQSLMNDFHALTDIGVAIVDLEGNVLVGTGWQEVCTKFHRVHPETARNCIESDTLLASGVAPGTFKVYKCKNNMWDMVTPIMIGDRHLGNLFLGQFFFEDEAPHLDVFREQARRYGFDEDAYLKAYQSIPRWSRKTVDAVMAFYCNLIGTISRLSYAHIKLARASEALRQSEQRFRSFVENANDMVYALSPEGVFTYMSPNWLEFMGEPAEEAIGKSFEPYVHPEDVHLCRAFLEKKLTTGEKQGSVEYRVRHRNGAWRWHVSNGSPVRDESGTVTGYVGIARDMTEAKQVEDELRQRENLLQKIFETLPAGLWLADKDGVLLRGNPAGVRIWGAEPHVSPPEYGIFKAWRLPSGEPIQAEDWALAKTIRAGVTIVDELLEIEAFDGHRKTILNYTAPVLDEKGEVSGAIVVNLDISDRMALEAQLAQSQKMDSVGRLAGGVAHDFNNMLNVILGHAELVLEELSEDSPLRADLEEILNAAGRSANLTRQLLAFARKQTVAPRELDLNETLGSMLKMLERLIGEDIDLLWKPGPQLARVRIDPGQVDQLLANLAVNARDAIGHANGKITIETANACFDAGYCAAHTGFMPGDYVMLAVSDDGCGMDEETRSQIFEPFFTTKGVGEGTGLGLATLYGIVKQNGGFVNVYSEPGEGTTFRIYLPALAAESGQQAAARKSAPASVGGHETILIVEDEAAILNMARAMLERLGYNVLSAATPGDAIRTVRDHAGKIDLVLTDVVMPEMNGRDLIRNLQEFSPGIRSLFMSGYTANVIAHQGVLDEGVNFIQKPFSRSQLAVKMREALTG
jgi:two-component system, cell cycle sensor histidine kinase and response regulator CckA